MSADTKSGDVHNRKQLNHTDSQLLDTGPRDFVIIIFLLANNRFDDPASDLAGS